MKVKIIERNNSYEFEKAINDFLSADKNVTDIKYSSFSTRFRGEYYSAMIIYEDRVV